MPINQPVNKEAIRILVQDFGYALTSQQTDIPEATLRQWAHRGNWNTPRAGQLIAIPHKQALSQSVTSPSVVHSEIMRERKEKTRANLAKYSQEASEELAEHAQKLKVTKEARDIASVASATWPEEQTGNVSFSLNVLNLGTCGIEVRDTQDASQDHPSIT